MNRIEAFLRTFPGFNSLTLWKICIGSLFYVYILKNIFSSLERFVFGVIILLGMFTIGKVRIALCDMHFLFRIASYSVIFCASFMVGIIVSAPFSDVIRSQVAYREKLEIINDTPLNNLDEKITNEERIAIETLVHLFEAYNEKDIKKIRSLDLRARKISDEENARFFDSGSNYILHYVGIISTDSKNICGRFMYSFEIKDEKSLSKNINLAVTNFILEKTEVGWVIAAASQYESGKKGMTQLIDTLSLQDKGKKKYGIDDLAKWSGLNQL